MTVSKSELTSLKVSLQRKDKLIARVASTVNVSLFLKQIDGVEKRI
jgi:hypothetical protein